MAVGATELRGKYAVAGIGETEYSRNSGRTTRAMGVQAIRNALNDAGIDPSNTSLGMLSYQVGGDAAAPADIGQDMGIRLDFNMDTLGGGGSSETLIGLACGAIENGMVDAMIVFRTMNGYTEFRMGGGGRGIPPFLTRHGGDTMHSSIYGMASALQNFSQTFVRHMYEFGTTVEQVAAVKEAHSKGASNNVKAYYKDRYTVEDVVNSRYIVKPFHLLDCCVETDNATTIVITPTAMARDLQRPVVAIQGVAGRTSTDDSAYHWNRGRISHTAGMHAGPILFGNAGVGPEDIDITGSYDAFTFTSLLQLEGYGFCPVGEGGNYVSDGTIELGGERPNNTSGGHLCEGYTHGMSMVIESVRQLRGQADDYCDNYMDGQHSYDYSEGHCRQVENAELTANLGWGGPPLTSAVIMTNRV